MASLQESNQQQQSPSDEGTLTYQVGGAFDVPQYAEISQVQMAGARPNLVPDGNFRLGLEIQDGSPVRLTRNEAGRTTLHMAAARSVDMMSGVLAHYNPPETVVLLNAKTENEGWTSLHISTIKNNSDVVGYILDKISDERQRQTFIDQVDQLGWTSLHWGATLDNVDALEATFGHMSVTHQEETMTSDWTLLHATATGDAVTTMDYLMGRWDSGTQWKILNSPSSNGKTALHIAVAEGNAKATIMLLDIAGESRARLLTKSDMGDKIAKDYTSDFKSPLLREYLEIATMFDGPVLHQVAERDDRFLLSWILEKCQNKVQEINSKNRAGLTVLQAASKSNSAEVIKEITVLLTQEELLHSLSLLSDGGETAIHFAAINNSASALHALLKAAKPELRKTILHIINGSDENVLQMAERLRHHGFVKIVNYHHAILADLARYFVTFEHGLFGPGSTEKQMSTKYKRIEKRPIGDSGLVRNINYDAATCIRYGDLEYARELIKIAVKIDGDNIHTWCNKGVLSLKLDLPQREEAEEAAFRMIELMSELTGVSRLRAKIDYAYWIAEVCRSESAYEESLQILMECQQESEGRIKEYCSYYQVKVLVRHLRSDCRFKRSEKWAKDLLDRVVDQLIILSTSANDEYLGDMWVWLAELQSNKIPREHVVAALDKFTTSTDIKFGKPLDCLNQAMEMEKKLSIDRKLKARIGKNCLECAYQCSEDDAKHRMHFFKKAQELSEQWISDNYWTHMSASTSAQALFNLWAMEFYVTNKDLVEEKHKQIFRKPIGTAKQAWYFLCTGFHSQQAELQECTEQYLQPAKVHLQQILQREDGWVNNGVKFAVIKGLLGDDKEEVEAVFNKAVQFSDQGFRRAIAYENFGLYYLEYGWSEQAKRMFLLARKESKGTRYNCCLATGGLRLINQWR